MSAEESGSPTSGLSAGSGPVVQQVWVDGPLDVFFCFIYLFIYLLQQN